MTAGRRLPRRLLVGTTSAALLAGAVGFIPFLGSASAAACPTWSDPAGDSGVITPAGTDPSGLSSDDDLDVLQTTVVVTGDGGMSVAVKVKGLKELGPDAAPGDEFVVNSSVAGTATKVTLARDTFFTGAESAKLAAAATATGTVKFDLATSTVTGTFTAAQVKTAFGKPVSGLKMDGFETLAYGYTLTPAGPSLGFPELDEAIAPATVTYTDAGGCGGSSADPTSSAPPPSSPSPSPPATTPAATGGLFDQPRKGCVTFKDATGDADPTTTGVDSENALDITQVNLKSPAGALQSFVKLVDPSAALLPIFDGPVYTTTFTVGGKTVAVSAPGTGAATSTVGGTASSDIKATAKVDTTNKNIVFTIPLDGLSKAIGSTVKVGTPISATKADTAADTALGAQAADSASGTTAAEKTYAYGDNSCFKPPPGVIEIDADPSGQYGDVTYLFATLKDADGSPVQDAKVTAVLTGGRPVSARTDEDGIAEIKIPLLLAGGHKTLTATYAGDPEVGPAKSTKAFTVLAEKTLLKAVAIRGGASASLVDNDRHAVVGRYVTFTVGSTKRLVRTNTKGVAVLTGVPRGAAVKAVFLSVKGYYLGTPTYTVRAL